MADELPTDPNPKEQTQDSPSNVDQLKEDLEKADKKIEQMEEKIKEQQKKTFQLSHAKSEGTTLVLSIVVGLMGIMGIGHLYLGKTKRGIIILAVGIFSWSLFFVPTMLLLGSDIPMDEYTLEKRISDMTSIIEITVMGVIALFIWQIIDARRLCKKYNKYLLDNEEPPW